MHQRRRETQGWPTLIAAMGRRTIPDQTAILSFETSTSRYLENSFSRTVYRRRLRILRRQRRTARTSVGWASLSRLSTDS